MRVLILTFTPLVDDSRVLRHVSALRDGHEIVTCALGPGVAGVEHVRLPDGVLVWPLTPGMVLLQTAGAVAAAYRRSPAARAGREALSGMKFDAVVCNDIETLPLALDVAGGAPVLVDLHEFAPEQFAEDWRWRIIRGRFLSRLCAQYLPRAAAISTVAAGIGEQYRARYAIDTVTTITNAAVNRHPQPRPSASPIRLVHSGVAIRNRQLELTVEAAANLTNVTLDLYLVTKNAADRAYLDQLRDLAAAAGNVRVLEPVPLMALPGVLDGYDAGIFLLPGTTAHKLHALPNKIFDWIQSGLGVIVGPSPEMSRVVTEHRIGCTTASFDVRDVRQTLAGLEPHTVTRWKANACLAAQRVNAEAEAVVLRGLVDEIAGRSPEQGTR